MLIYNVRKKRRTLINPNTEQKKQQNRAIVKSTYLTFLFLLFSAPNMITGIFINIQALLNTYNFYDTTVRFYKSSNSPFYLVASLQYVCMASNLPILLLTNTVFFNEAKNSFKELVNFTINTKIYNTVVQITTMLDAQATQQHG
jgi:hypothetical protein